MAAVTLYGSGSQISSNDDSNRSVAITTATDDLIVVAIAATGLSAAWSSVLVSDDQGGTYTNIGGAGGLKSASADQASVWVRGARVTTGGACTITADFTTNAATHTGASLIAHKVTGMSRAGSGAVRQSAVVSNQAASGTPTPVLAATALTTNALIGYVFNATNPATMTPRASWVEAVDSGHLLPTTGIETASIDSGEVASSIAWGGTSASAYCAAVIELDASALAGAITGTSSLTFTGAGTLTGKGALTGSSTITFAPSATLTGGGALTGTSTLTFTPTGTIRGAAPLTGTSTLTFAASGTLSSGSSGVIAGSSSLTFATSGTLTGNGPLVGTSSLTFSGIGTLLDARPRGFVIVKGSPTSFAASGGVKSNWINGGSASPSWGPRSPNSTIWR